ncbi:hypothetical protein LRS06_15335 [Hymenobacter sp. J193]|uniref:hypothetical protein n=1 Tax=Hymenobacter sp. J193 TaxID=2898429 RepID=UPI00215121DC|nr:hypothetical protein [Hymenobacter sp. J193]MCR5889110.1 hypothetical protein [Hymenobacter sp. J193]
MAACRFRYIGLIATCWIGTILPTTAQTALIAHRSHSGRLATFEPAINDNFGLVAKPYEQRIDDTPDAEANAVIWVSDSTVLVEKLGVAAYTLQHSAYPKLLTGNKLMLALKARFPRATLVGFAKSEQRKAPKQRKATSPQMPGKAAPKPAKATVAAVVRREPPASQPPQPAPAVTRPTTRRITLLGLTAILTLTFLGWLLSEKPRPAANNALA